jgi:hypothetical protein
MGSAVMSRDVAEDNGIPAAIRVTGLLLGTEQQDIARARQFKAADTPALRELMADRVDPDAPQSEVFAAALGRLQAIVTGLLITLDRLAASAPAPAVPDDMAPSGPAAGAGHLNPYEQAAERYEQATTRFRLAETESARLMQQASDEWDAAQDNLRQYEESPGIPRPEYRWWTDAVAGKCSHGGHGWDGETCTDAPAVPVTS